LTYAQNNYDDQDNGDDNANNHSSFAAGHKSDGFVCILVEHCREKS